MTSLLIRGARIVTPATTPGPRRGRAMGRLDVMSHGDTLVSGGRIVSVGPSPSPVSMTPAPDVFDARGRVLLPAFIDCHTHACWVGSRLDEWERRLAGETYLQILASGGADGLLERLAHFARGGTTTVEVKSGYGLTAEHELKMLRAIRDAAAAWPGTVIPTALLGHAIDPDQPDFVARTINETLPAVHTEFPGIAVDAYCEAGAWSLDDTIRLLRRAAELGHPVRLHADQFNSLGGLPAAISLRARSADHLEASTPDDLARLAASDTAAVALPICALHLDNRFARLRGFIDAGGVAAVATNCNPGSAPSTSMPLALATAVRSCGLTPQEAIAAATINAASILGLDDRGFIAPGARADLVLLDATDERELTHQLAGDPIAAVWSAGQRLR
jgi:imidazolonepropionase